MLSLQAGPWPRSRKTAGAAPTNGPRGARNGSKPVQRTLAEPPEPPTHLPPLALGSDSLPPQRLISGLRCPVASARGFHGKIKIACIYRER